ncbi:hypothetical protein JCM10449v2_000700 [Rhodotorula kratochvilovae]
MAVRLANQATPDALLDRLREGYGASRAKEKHIEVSWQDQSAFLQVHATKTLPSSVKDWAWELFERNMRSLYEATEEGYDPAEKRAELFHPDSRFLLLFPSAPSSSVPPPTPLGCCIFRFDTEETASEDDDELCDVAYCYELQVEAATQGKGVGRVLMDALDRLARAFKMDKTMLTVFKANRPAILFYEKLGYTEDEIDPGTFGVEDVEYWILSKACS